MLNQCFTSVFTVQKNMELPVLAPSHTASWKKKMRNRNVSIRNIGQIDKTNSNNS